MNILHRHLSIMRGMHNFVSLQRTLSHPILYNIQLNRQVQLDASHRFDNYEEAKKNFNLPVPEYFNFARDFIDQWAAAEKTGFRETSNPAFWWLDSEFKTEIKWSFQQLSSMSKRVANVLRHGCQLNRGDKIVVILPKVPEWWLLNVACIRADIILSPGSTLLQTKDIQHRLALSEAKCIITSPDFVQFVDEASSSAPFLSHKIVVGDGAPRPGWTKFESLFEKASDDFECVNTRSSDPMTLFFTSGTTGLPKMTEHTHASYGLGHTLTARYMLTNSSKSVIWNMSDTGWAKCSWSSIFGPWIHGSCVFIHNSPKFDPGETLRVLSQFPVTHFCASATVYRFLVSEPLGMLKMKALQHCITAGEPANPEMIEKWLKLTGFDIHEAYGQTETTIVCGRYPCIPYKPGSMGKACPGITLDIVDDNGQPVEQGKEGNMALKVKPNRPISLFSKYLNDPERTASVFTGDYYLLGDRGYKDEEDYFFFVARADDVIISSGYRIGPFEVESALLEHPAVLESAVVSSPDAKRGEVVKAFVVLLPNYETVDKNQLKVDLQEYVKSVTAPYKYPRKIEFVTELPKTVSGKIRRIDLRNMEWNKKS